MEICPHLMVKNYGDEGMGFCKLTERPSGRIQQCVLEGYDICETWEEIKAEQKSESYEAGADAMYEPAYKKGRADLLEELRTKGIKTNKFKTNSNPIYLTNPRQNGVYVFIPEEKTIGGRK